MLPAWQHRPDAPPCMSGSRTSDRGQTVENQLQPLQEAAGRLGWTVVADLPRRGYQRRHGARQAAWTGCSAEGCCPARVRHRGGMVVCRLGRSLVRPDRSAGRATIPRHRPLPAPAGARHFDAIRSDAVRHVGRVQRVRAGDDPRSSDGRPGSRTVIGQAPGPAEDDAVHGAAHPCGIGSRAVVCARRRGC